MFFGFLPSPYFCPVSSPLPPSFTSQPATCLQFEIRQLRAHLAQQDLDLAAEREAAMQIHHVWGKQGRNFQVVEGATPGESDDEGAQRNPREPLGTAGTIWFARHLKQ